jgi:hypothetical protein
VHEGIIELIDDLVVHRAAELRVRVQHDGDRRMFGARRMIATFDPAGGTGKDDFGHSDLNCRNPRGVGAGLCTYGALDGDDGRA